MRDVFGDWDEWERAQEIEIAEVETEAAVVAEVLPPEDDGDEES